MRWLILLTLQAATARAQTTPPGCVFDHALVTISADAYRAVDKFFGEATSSKRLGTTWWPDQSGQKGFVVFPNKTSLEIWNGSKYSRYGFQDACRVGSLAELQRIGKALGQKPTRYGDFDFSVVGRAGVVGDAAGGTFFIHWGPKGKPQTTPGAFGIRSISKRVGAQVFEHLANDYALGRLTLTRDGERAMTASDAAGVERRVTRGEDPWLSLSFSCPAGPAKRTVIFEDAGSSISLTTGDGCRLDFK